MWNANLYNQYNQERIQPSIDLAVRMKNHDFRKILDVGCGTGMSTVSIKAVWENADIIGVDLSAEMLQKASEVLPGVTFMQRDCGNSLDDLGKFDLVFSNAFLQWLPEQERFIRKSFEMVNEGGVWAAQIPLFDDMPASQCICEAEKTVVGSMKKERNNTCKCYKATEYYDMLSNVTDTVTMWITEYCHEMPDQKTIVEFLKSTALRPYIEKLEPDVYAAFQEKVLQNLIKAYPTQKNGKVLFPFKRLFLIGEK